jgi:large subunit ribosomal protein L5
MIRLKEKYQKEVIPAMKKDHGYKNVMAMPKIVKVVVNSCFGKDAATKTSQEREKVAQNIANDLALITGQKAKIVKSKKSIAGFKLRGNIDIAAVVTLRKNKMYEFLERLLYLTLPRSRDFQGLNSKGIDKKGNLTVGFKEHISFPEVITEKEKTIFGLEVTVVTNAKTKEEGLLLYRLLGFPIRADKVKAVKKV